MTVRTTLAALAVLALGNTSPALAIPIVSGANTPYTSTVVTSPGTTVVVTPHPLWQAPFGGAQWISYAQTGFAEAVLAPQAGTVSNPTGQAIIMSIELTFSVLADSILNLSVWADDTAGLFLDGAPIIGPNFTQLVCADGVIGCEPDEGFSTGPILWTPGNHSILFNFYQVGSGDNTIQNPFGALYNGSLDPIAVPVPEPVSMMLLGTGLMGLAASARRRRNRKS